MGHSVLSGRALDNLKSWLTLPVGNVPDNYSKIMDWAADPDHGGLPRASARAFANWLTDNWYDWADNEGTVEDVLEGAVTDWCGGRVDPS